MEIGEQVYETLLNAVEEEYRLPWVTPVFVPGHPCFDAYCDLQVAYDRLRQRLDVQDENADVEAIIDCLLKHGKILALEMFRYGMLYQIRQNKEQPGA